MRMVEPAGNSITSLASHRMRCPPLVGSNIPNAVTPHHPKGQFRMSRCLKVQTFGPKLKVAAGKIDLGKRGFRCGRTR